VEIPISETPKKIEFMMMKHSAAEFVKAKRVAFIVSAENLTDLKSISNLRLLWP
jgi:hypothetical protein